MWRLALIGLVACGDNVHLPDAAGADAAAPYDAPGLLCPPTGAARLPRLEGSFAGGETAYVLHALAWPFGEPARIVVGIRGVLTPCATVRLVADAGDGTCESHCDFGESSCMVDVRAPLPRVGVFVHAADSYPRSSFSVACAWISVEPPP